MKCYKCKKELIESDHPLKNSNNLECPNYHMNLITINSEVKSYWYIWDEDEKGKKRFKICSNQNLRNTTVIKYQYPNFFREETILNMPFFLTPKIKDDIICLDNVISKIKNLILFL